MSTERPDPSWSAEKMAAYMRERYGEPRFIDARTKQPIPWRDVVGVFDDKREPRK